MICSPLYFVIRVTGIIAALYVEIESYLALCTPTRMPLLFATLLVRADAKEMERPRAATLLQCVPSRMRTRSVNAGRAQHC